MQPKSFVALFFAALILTLLLSAGQFYGFKADEFMGQNTEAIAKGFLKFYPGTAYLAVAKVLAFGFGIVVLMLACFRGIHLVYRNQPLALRLTLDVLFTWALCAVAWSSVVQYPALFANYFPTTWMDGVYRASFWLTPEHLRWGGWIVMALVAGPGLVQVFLHFLRLPKVVVLPVLGVLVGSVFLVGFSGGADKHEKPHVLIIGIDSLRNDRFEMEKVMPNLVALTKDEQSVYFKDHIVGIARTFPSWIEMLQGKYSPQTGVRHMFPGLDRRSEEFTGLGTAFRDAGYETVAVSDFAGDIFPRFAAGFNDVRAPKLSITNMIRMGAYQKFPLFMLFAVQKPFWRWFPVLKENASFSDPHHLADEVKDAFSDHDDKPLFLLSFFSTAHFPYAAPYPYYKQFTDPQYTGPYKFQKNPSIVDEKNITEADKKQINALYNGGLYGIDHALGELFTFLKDEGVWDNTMIIVTADHGEDLYDFENLQGHGDHLRGENVFRVPLLVKLPKGKTPARRDIPFVSRSIDIAPTVSSLAGLQPVGEGKDFSSVMFNAQAEDPQLAAYSETEIWFAPKGELFYQKKRLQYPGISQLLNFDLGGSDDIVLKSEYEDLLVTARHRSLIAGDYKLIYMPTQEGIEYQLFNRRTDPYNLQDLAETEPRRTDEMAKRLMTLIGKLETRYKIVDGYVLPRY